jgi:hypothetical protein
MVGSLVCGVAFAMGHHFFYSSWNAQIVQSSAQQEWNIRIGTALAFLVKVCLTGAAGFAYTQLLWTTLTDRPVTLDGIDSLFSIATSAWEFLSLELWQGTGISIDLWYNMVMGNHPHIRC